VKNGFKRSKDAKFRFFSKKVLKKFGGEGKRQYLCTAFRPKSGAGELREQLFFTPQVVESKEVIEMFAMRIF